MKSNKDQSIAKRCGDGKKKAENHSFTPADDDRTTCFNLLVKFPTAVPVIFAIVEAE